MLTNDVTIFLLLLALAAPHSSSSTGRDKGHAGHAATYFLHRYDKVEWLDDEANKQINRCILKLEYAPTNCQIYMQQLMLKFLPIMYKPSNFSLQEVLTWSLDRYDAMMLMCDENCFNITLAYSYKGCTDQLPIERFFPSLTNEVFSAMLLDFASLLCHKNPHGESCMKSEAELVTGRSTMTETIQDSCLVKDEITNSSILPALCLTQCKQFLQTKKDEYGCCIKSWTNILKYTQYLSRIIYIYPDKLSKLLEFCEIESPGFCPFVPDLTKLSTGLITFLAIAGACAVLVLAIGIFKNMKEM